MRASSLLMFAAVVGVGITVAQSAQAVPTIFAASGANPAAIQGSVDAFRAALGANNGNIAGSQPGGRREINWDGGGAGAPATISANPMTTFAFRGNVNTTPGTGLEISGQPSPEFGEINPTYPTIFQTFSAPRLFAPLGSNIVDVFFTVPGTTDQAATSLGFGAVFTDVDLPLVSKMEFFDGFGQLLLLQYAFEANQGLSFLGAIFDDPILARVRITLGNAALGPNDGGGVDVVVLDDFIYGEPQGVPEPATLGLMGASLIGLWLAGRRRFAQAH
jgi:hypothetical protein